MQIEKLKAERVQEALAAGAVEERLKAERVQESLKALPGWRLATGGAAIERIREFPDPQVAAGYTAFLAHFAARRKQPVIVALAGARVAVTLYGKARRGRRGEVDRAVLDFAQALG